MFSMPLPLLIDPSDSVLERTGTFVVGRRVPIPRTWTVGDLYWKTRETRLWDTTCESGIGGSGNNLYVCVTDGALPNRERLSRCGVVVSGAAGPLEILFRNERLCPKGFKEGWVMLSDEK